MSSSPISTSFSNCVKIQISVISVIWNYWNNCWVLACYHRNLGRPSWVSLASWRAKCACGEAVPAPQHFHLLCLAHALCPALGGAAWTLQLCQGHCHALLSSAVVRQCWPALPQGCPCHEARPLPSWKCQWAPSSVFQGQCCCWAAGEVWEPMMAQDQGGHGACKCHTLLWHLAWWALGARLLYGSLTAHLAPSK